MSGAAEPPVLWQLKASPYSEKARWALDYKRVPHVRRSMVPGQHRAKAKRLAGGTTFPVLELDGKALGDSTDIVAALEQRAPDPPLYPADPSERDRALALEDFFDEQLGVEGRRLFVDILLRDPDLMFGALTPDVTGFRRTVARAAFPLLRRQTRAAFHIDDAGVARAHEKLRAACERFRAELRPSGYLVGDRFTVADLTAASMIAPIVAPEQFQYPQPQRGHPLVEPLREELATGGLAEWTREMYVRHRGESAAIRD